ncbi:MAG TPA: lasso RiPP family leader peptide-containing protein [Pyrinomonadaceae bacterium]|nr:lasso RiPP family leader peptide-containing protein [Pyrinomonadaceae bacterium]
MELEQESLASEEEPGKRKEYRKPELVSYGDVRTVTQGGAMSLNSDSGMNLMSPP